MAQAANLQKWYLGKSTPKNRYLLIKLLKKYPLWDYVFLLFWMSEKCLTHLAGFWYDA